MGKTLPLVSIITVCLNADKTIRRTIESVLAQTYDNLEYILVDGCSTDGTMGIVSEYGDKIDVVISEKDSGISDAFNKGVRCARGEYIKFLNADDYLPADFIEKSVEILGQHPSAAFIFGDMVMIDGNGKTTMQILGDADYGSWLNYLVPRVNHPTFLVRRSVYEKHGLFDPAWHYAMDYEWLLRVHQAGEIGLYAPNILIYAQEGGASSNWLKTMREQRSIIVRYSSTPVLAYLMSCCLTAKIALRVVLENFLPRHCIMLFRPGKSLK